MSQRSVEDFKEVKALTKGYLKPDTYHAIYLASYKAPEGLMIDIGPAQGGSSISLGLGIKDSGKTASKVVSIELGKASNALSDKDDVEANERVLKSNIDQFGVSDSSIVLMGSVSDVSHLVPADGSISVLFIDADGAIDRDFELFYHRVCPGGIIVIDDCEEKIENKYLEMSEEKVERFLIARTRQGKMPEPTLEHTTPLGKYFTTVKFVDHFLKENLLEKIEMKGNTIFCRKPDHVASDYRINMEDMMDIRRQIVAKYQEMRAGAAE